MKIAILALAVSATLLMGGCSQNANTLTLTVAEIPQSTLKCLPAPYRNKKFVKINMKQAAYLLSRYKTAHADCYSKLETVRRIHANWKKKAGKK